MTLTALPTGLDRFKKAIVSKRSGRCNFCDTLTQPDSDYAIVTDSGKWVAVCSPCSASVTAQCKAIVATIGAETASLDLTADDLAEIDSFCPANIADVLAGTVDQREAVAAVIKLGDALACVRTFIPEADVLAPLRAAVASPKLTEWERDFATSAVRQIEDGRTLSEKQDAVVTRILDKLNGNAPAPVAAPTVVVPEGRYALREDDGTVKFYRVEHGKAGGKWAGYVFVSAQASDDLYPIRNRDSRNAILTAIGADPQAAVALYGQELGVCGRCGLTLTSEYRKLGIGPVCINKAW